MIKKVIFILFFISIFLSFNNLYSAENLTSLCKIIKIKGEALVCLMASNDWKIAKEEMLLKEGDIIKTGANSNTILEITGLKSDDGKPTIVELGPNTQLLLARLLNDQVKGIRKTLLDLALGKIIITTQKIHTDQAPFEVKTPTSVVGVRGTKFSVEVEPVD